MEAVAAGSGVYEDNGISGTKGRDKRPGFNRLLKDATARTINMIAAWSVDRLGRKQRDLIGLLNRSRRPMSEKLGQSFVAEIDLEATTTWQRAPRAFGTGRLHALAPWPMYLRQMHVRRVPGSSWPMIEPEV